MVAPVKQKKDKVSLVRGTFYLTQEQNLRVIAECRRAGSGSKADVIRRLIQKHLPPSTVVKVTVNESD